jgi:hypothetical protein
MRAGVAGVWLLCASSLCACGRQELWNAGATGGSGAVAGRRGAVAGGGGAGTTSSAAGTTGGGAGAVAGGGGSGGTAPDAGTDALQPFDDGFDVGSLPGLVLWLKGTSGVTLMGGGSAVASWQDDSPSRNDLENNGHDDAEFVASNQQRWYWGGGFDVVDFDYSATMATLDRTNGTSTLAFGTGDLLIEVVAAFQMGTFSSPELFTLGAPGMTAFGPMIDFDTNSAPQGSITARGLGDAFLTSRPGLGDKKLHLVAARRTVAGAVATLEIHSDGHVDQTKTGSKVRDLPAAFAQLGPAATVAEVVVIKGPISDAALAALEDHLLSKYGLK